ncbi:hypothetical protein K474DRAFT_1659327 [Panus rudis PR-1116 ss-1]|nr:hypothetical protein K474DRAFT_1659327 [Panus rudis PR-1116 ss-1]
MNAIAPENEPAFEADDDSEPNIIVSGGSAGLGERADDSEPAPPKRLKRTVRVIEAISQITSAAYKDTRVYEETAEYLLWEIQSLRATLKQECNCTTSMFQYLAWWQSSKSRWTNTELYGSMVKARQRPDGKYEEIYSDEEPVSG